MYISLNIYCIHGKALQAAISHVIRSITFKSLIEPPIYTQTQICALVSTTCESGLVIDIGYNETRILPICHGKVITTALKIVSIGAVHVLNRLKAMLIDDNPHLLLKPVLDENNTLEDILARICYCDPRIAEEQDRLSLGGFVAGQVKPNPWPEITDFTKEKMHYARNQQKKARAISLTKIIVPKSILQVSRPRSLTSSRKKSLEQARQYITYYCSDDIRITIEKGIVRTQPLEVLFRPNSEGESILKGIFDSVRACEMDARKHVINNVVVCGGGSMYTGLTRRLCAEILHRVNSSAEDRSMRALYDKMRLYKSKIFPSNITAWNGASIMATKLSGASLHLSKTSSPLTPTKK